METSSINRKTRIGLIVNPIAGMGGRVGLKGTDGPEVYQEAIEKGAKPESATKAARALEPLLEISNQFELITCNGAMGETTLSLLGLAPAEIIDIMDEEISEPADTMKAVVQMNRIGIDLLMFAGGDGTARNISAVNFDNTICIGIPAGVKIQSSAFARTPREAGTIIHDFITGKIRRIKEAEVMDLDEKLYRQGIVAPKLFGSLLVPDVSGRMQPKKFRSASSDISDQMAIASEVVRNIKDELVLIGPGSTTQAIMKKLGLESTLIGVDAIKNGALIGKDLNESEILELIKVEKAKLVLTPIGGQGFLLGRGNQQISPKVIRLIGKDNFLVVATKQKLNSLPDNKLWVDTGDLDLDFILKGYVRVITGIKEAVVFKLG